MTTFRKNSSAQLQKCLNYFRLSLIFCHMWFTLSAGNFSSHSSNSANEHCLEMMVPVIPYLQLITGLDSTGDTTDVKIAVKLLVV